ncbi:MAG TPA: hypothetical protein VF432_25195 [Thermoanaerobaculia bacterium]
MTTRLDLPDDLLEEIQNLASQQGRVFDEMVTDLLRKALGTPFPVPTADQTTVAARRRIAEKFISGEWGVEKPR